MEKYMKMAIKEAKKSAVHGDVPVGAIIVMNNEIIAKGYNTKEKSQNAIKHAEIVAIERACKKLKNWRLDGCAMYVTMEPCLMCAGAILQSRIKSIVYAVENSKFGYAGSIDNVLTNNANNHTVEVKHDYYNEEIVQMLTEFFKKKRI